MEKTEWNCDNGKCRRQRPDMGRLYDHYKVEIVRGAWDAPIVAGHRTDEHEATMKLTSVRDTRHEKAATRLRELAASRSGDSDTQEHVFNLLERWYVLGKPAAGHNGQGADE